MLLTFLIPFYANSQSRWSGYTGIYFTGDAQMYYIGPSVLLGSDFLIKKNVSASFYGHYFARDYGDHGFQTLTVAALGQVNIGNKKKFYVAIGIAWQRAIEEDDLYSDVIDRSIIIPAYRVGYHFVFKKFILSPEINTTGPYTDKRMMSTELFTLSSIGVRLHFINNPNRK